MSETATETPAAPEAGQEPQTAPQTPATPQQQAPAPAQPAQNGSEPASQEPQASQPEPQRKSGVEDLPPWAQKELREARSDAAKQRAAAKEQADQRAALEQKSQDQLDAIAKALGLKPEEATPEQIMAERDAEKQRADAQAAQARANAVELAVFRAAGRLGADGDALLDSRSFVAKLAGLDPSADGFAGQVADLIKTAADDDAKYRAAPPLQAADTQPPAEQPKPQPTVPSSGAQFTGAPSGPRQWTEADVANANPSQVQEAINKGLLQNLGFGAKRAARR